MGYLDWIIILEYLFNFSLTFKIIRVNFSI